MMQKLKRLIKYILYGIPIRQEVKVNTIVVPHNELLKGKTALVTGGTSGIGYEIAKVFSRSGANVIITGRTKSKIESAIQKLQGEGLNCFGTVWDVRDVASFDDNLRHLLSEIPSHQLDILVNNAGLVGGDISDCKEDKYDAILDTNLKGTFFMTQTIGKYMKMNGIKGNILNIGSSSSLRPANSAYTLSKWGIFGFTKGMAKALAPYGITVNGIAPGPTATPMLMPNGIEDDLSFPNPLGRYIHPGEIANLALFLVSAMGRAIVGDMVFMTGGSGLITYDDVSYNF